VKLAMDSSEIWNEMALKSQYRRWELEKQNALTEYNARCQEYERQMRVFKEKNPPLQVRPPTAPYPGDAETIPPPPDDDNDVPPPPGNDVMSDAADALTVGRATAVSRAESIRSAARHSLPMSQLSSLSPDNGPVMSRPSLAVSIISVSGRATQLSVGGSGNPTDDDETNDAVPAMSAAPGFARERGDPRNRSTPAVSSGQALPPVPTPPTPVWSKLPVPLVAFAQLPSDHQHQHLIDANEVIRTIMESGFTIGQPSVPARAAPMPPPRPTTATASPGPNAKTPV